MKINREEISKFLKTKKGKKLIIILLVFSYIYLIFELLWFYFNATLDHSDLYDFSYGANLLLDGVNPYTVEDLWTRHHPPGIFILYALIFIIFGKDYFILKTLGYLAVLTTAIVLFYTSKIMIEKYKHGRNRPSISHNESSIMEQPIRIELSREYWGFLPWVVPLLFLLDFAVQDRVSEGSYEAYTTMFFAIGFYFFVKNKHMWAAFFWGVSLIIQLVFFFVWPLLLLYFLKLKDWRRFSIYFWVISLMIIGFFLPFLIDDFNAVIESFFLLTSRRTTHYSFFWFFSNGFEEILYQKISFVSLWFIIQISGFLFIHFLVLRNKKVTKENLIYSLLIIYLSLPILTNSYGIRFLNWASPICYSFLILKGKKLIVFLYYSMSFFCIVLFFYRFFDYPWMAVISTYIFSLSMIFLLYRNLEKKRSR